MPKEGRIKGKGYFSKQGTKRQSIRERKSALKTRGGGVAQRVKVKRGEGGGDILLYPGGGGGVQEKRRAGEPVEKSGFGFSRWKEDEEKSQ